MPTTPAPRVTDGSAEPAAPPRTDGPAGAIAARFADAPVHSRYSRRVAAPPADVRRAINEVTIDDLRVTRLLMGARSAPYLVAGAIRRRQGSRRTSRPHPEANPAQTPTQVQRPRQARSPKQAQTLLEQFAGMGFVWLHDGDDGIAAGGVAQFWRPRPAWAPGVRDADTFYAFVDPGWAKAVTTVTVSADGTGSRLTTTTAVVGTDDAARRAFRRYWLVIGAPSGLIRREWLAAIGRRAEGRQG
jgi:hypothetical protein